MQTASTTTRNIKAISELEHGALAQRSISARMGDVIASHAGKMWFIVFHMVWFCLWLWLNSESKSRFAFDPFPFQLLSTIVSLESIFLSLFILMSQNRATRVSDRRAHVDLQVNLLAEAEMTKVLNLLRALCKVQNLPEANDPELTELARETSPAELINELKQALPDG